MGLREVKTELNQLEKSALIKQISDLYKKFKPVKEYLDFHFNQNESELLAQYKEKVAEGFFPKRGCEYELRLSVSRKAINDFKKLGVSQESLADLLLHYVECGVEFTNTFGDIDENFYASVENTYEKALELMGKAGILDKFESRALKIVTDTRNIGWGFHDYLSDVYHSRYE